MDCSLFQPSCSHPSIHLAAVAALRSPPAIVDPLAVGEQQSLPIVGPSPPSFPPMVVARLGVDSSPSSSTRPHPCLSRGTGLRDGGLVGLPSDRIASSALTRSLQPFTAGKAYRCSMKCLNSPFGPGKGKASSRAVQPSGGTQGKEVSHSFQRGPTVGLHTVEWLTRHHLLPPAPKLPSA